MKRIGKLKKTIVLVTAFLLMLSLSGCGGNKKDNEKSVSNNTEENTSIESTEDTAENTAENMTDKNNNIEAEKNELEKV